MQSAPAVSYPAGAVHFERRLRAALAGLGLGVLAAWAWALNGDLVPAWWLATGGMLALAAWGQWLARYPRNGELAWEPHPGPRQEGEAAGQWRWTSAAWQRGTPVEHIEWAWDLQTVVLLRLRNPDDLRWWVWLAQDRRPADWDAMRRALKAHTPTP
jgi:hypothetical protein